MLSPWHRIVGRWRIFGSSILCNDFPSTTITRICGVQIFLFKSLSSRRDPSKKQHKFGVFYTNFETCTVEKLSRFPFIGYSITGGLWSRKTFQPVWKIQKCFISKFWLVIKTSFWNSMGYPERFQLKTRQRKYIRWREKSTKAHLIICRLIGIEWRCFVAYLSISQN